MPVKCAAVGPNGQLRCNIGEMPIEVALRWHAIWRRTDGWSYRSSEVICDPENGLGLTYSSIAVCKFASDAPMKGFTPLRQPVENAEW